MPASTLDEARRILEHFYHEIWYEWFPSPQFSPAKLELQMRCTDAAYVHADNRIVICVGEWNLEEDFPRILQKVESPLGRLGWYSSQSDVVHEMIHEFQFKVVPAITVEGTDLFDKYRDHFQGPGHNEVFFSSIASKADYFGLTASEFVIEL